MSRNVTPLLPYTTDANSPPERAGVPIPANKFTPPQEADSQLRRARLLDPLPTTLPRLLLACAPAGFGKTTLLQQLHRHCLEQGHQVLWCNLDAADNDLSRFVEVIASGLRDQQDAWPEAPTPAQLLRQVAQRDRPFTLVLDELEVIQAPAALGFIRQLLDALPPNGHLAIGTRSMPALELGRLRAQGQVLEFNTDALRFSLDETRCYLRERCRLALGEPEIETLSRRTEGWITALYLASLSLRWHEDPTMFVQTFSGTHLDLAEYLAEDLLAQQSEDMRGFLLQTSILNRFNAPLCDALTGRGDSQALLQQLEQANLLLIPLDAERRWFRYHPLFASYLHQVLERECDGARAQLHRNAAHWYLSQARPEAALDHLFAAGDLDEVARQLALHAKGWMFHGQARLMLPWLERLPLAVLDANPALGLIYAWTLMHARRYADVLRLVERPALARPAATLKVQLLAMTDRMEDAYHAGQTQLQRLSRTEDEAEYLLVAYYLSFCMICTGRFDEARRLLVQLPRSSHYLRNGAAAVESVLDLIQGQLDSALTRLRASERHALTSGENSTPSLVTVLGIALYEADELTEAEERLGEALPQVTEMSSPDALITGHVLLARLALLRNDRERWMHLLAQLEQQGHQAGSMRILCSVWLEQARVATLEGRFDTAQHGLNAAEQLKDWEQPGLSFYSNDADTPFIARQRLRVAKGDAGVIADLRAALRQAQALRHLRRALKVRLLLAMALDGAGEHAAALEELTQALKFASHVGLMRSFLDEGSRLSALLERWSVTLHGRAESLGIAPAFLARLQQRVAPDQDSGTREAEDEDATAVTPRELQVLRFLALGYRNREIAEKMFLSELTVKSHLRKINTKLSAQGRTEAVAIARSRGLLD
ncbi:LuxR C-terminal-related transcriptional regulator [Metapseudomonas furukawaii]|uniref:LuxR C-terminal-related transcriptional regulator n=1 Tax=Metapseudomonas furukawaii TaxID=1149133 RepID=UPI00404657CF